MRQSLKSRGQASISRPAFRPSREIGVRSILSIFRLPWTSPDAPSREDWTLLLERDDTAVDRTPPRLVAAVAAGPERVQITFSKPVEPVSACGRANYAVDRDVKVLKAVLADEAGRTIRLTTSPLAEDVQYTLTVGNIRDRADQPNTIRSGERITFLWRNPARPLIVLEFREGQGRTTANTGTSSKSHSTATLTAKRPQWSTNAAPPGDGRSLDFGGAPGEYAVDLGSDAPESLQGLTSFTITAWVNCRSLEVGSGGNRIVHMADTMGSRSGLDLVVERKGELVLGVNAYPDASPARSRPNAIPVDSGTGPDNWRFLAVTYDAAAATEHVKFYFGDARHAAKLDRAATYAQGPLGPRTGPVTIGSFSLPTRVGKGDRLFRGLIDDVRIFGSPVDGAGALDLEQIRSVQRGKARGK